MNAAAQAMVYTFERESGQLRVGPSSRRTVSDAKSELAVLRHRLGIDPGIALPADCEEILLKYCTDVVLNIVWYDRARKREQQRNRNLTVLAVATMVLALLLLVASALPPLLKEGGSTTSGVPVLVLSGAVLTVLQVLATLGDGKARLAIFWKAGADLKELLYTFEQKWHRTQSIQRAGVDPVVVSEEFLAAVHDDLRAARGITRAERLEYFATLRSPADVMALAIAAADSLRARRGEATTAVSGREERVAEAKKTVAEARAAVLASEFRLKGLAGSEKASEETVLLKARAELVRAESIAQDLMNG